jgi:hypothetical protein
MVWGRALLPVRRAQLASCPPLPNRRRHRPGCARRPGKGASALQNHLRDGLLGGVRNRKRGVLHSQPRGELCRDPVK